MRGKEILVSAILFGGLGGYAWSSLPPAALASTDQRARIERRAAYAGCIAPRPAADASVDRNPTACRPHRSS